MSTLPAGAAVVDAILESTRPVTEAIFEGLESAREEIRQLTAERPALRSLEHLRCSFARVGLARVLMREHLASVESGLGGWELNERVTTNGAILLHRGLQSIRLLHVKSKDAVPHAGPNRARMDWFRNPNPAADPALLEQDQRLLWLWNIDDERRGRLVHPLEAGSFGRKPRADVDVTVIREADDFSSLSFRGNLDEPLDLDTAIDEQEFTGTDDEKL